MIFVTVGTHTDPFDRLLMAMDKITPTLDEEVVMQCGCSKYIPINAAHFSFLDDEAELMNLYRESTLVVCHAGAGTIMTALSFGKPIVTVPRLLRYNEHMDDQQIELASKLEKEGYLLSVQDINDLFLAIQKARKMPVKTMAHEMGLVVHIKQFLKGLE